MTNVTINVNTGTIDEELGATGVEFVEMNVDNDYLIFSNGSDVVKDGESIPSSSDLTQAGIIITTSDVIVPKYLLADISAVLLKEIHNAGDQNKRYVFAFSFDGETASEPILEVWDSEDMNTVDSYSLGEGVPSDSWMWGIVTTDALPGANWLGTTPTVGQQLAGASDGHFLWLNDENGALTSAKVLYCQLKIIVPANFENPGAEEPVFVVKYTHN